MNRAYRLEFLAIKEAYLTEVPFFKDRHDAWFSARGKAHAAYWGTGLNGHKKRNEIAVRLFKEYLKYRKKKKKLSGGNPLVKLDLLKLTS